MSDNVSKPTATPGDTRTSDRSAPRRHARGGGLFTLLIALAAFGISGYLGYLTYLHRDLLQGHAVSRLDRLERENTDLRRQLTGLQANLAGVTQTQVAIKGAIDKIDAELGHGRSAWIVAEAEQLMLIANHRLQLAGDVNAAIAALGAADQALSQLTDPRLLPVRKRLAEEITRLQAVAQVDVPGIALRIGAIAEGVDQLPLAMTVQFQQPGAAGAAAKPAAQRGFWQQFWHDLLSLVRIRRNVESYKPLLAPDEAYFLRQNLQLQLYGAQYALLRNDTAVYKQNLTTARKWLQQYFDANAPAVKGAEAELDKLLAEKIVTAMPDISGSLEALKAATRTKANP